MHFEVHGYRSEVGSEMEQRRTYSARTHSTSTKTPKKMFLGSFTAKGPGQLVNVERRMDSDKYKAILQMHLLPVVHRDFPDGESIFQQDLAPCHTSRKVCTFFAESGLTILDWPGNSPDLNPIENLWVIMKHRIEKDDCSTMEKLISSIIKTWYPDDELAKMYLTLVDSMPNRVAMLIGEKGSHISY